MQEKPERIYVILITLIILTQDKSFCQAVQGIVCIKGRENR